MLESLSLDCGIYRMATHRHQRDADIGLRPADGQIKRLRIGNHSTRRRGKAQHHLAKANDRAGHRASQPPSTANT